MRSLKDFAMVLSDFSGTVTDETARQEEYVAHMAAHMSSLDESSDPSPYEIMIHRAMDQVRSHPHLFNWERGGTVIASAAVNPYVLVRTAVRRVLQDLGASPARINALIAEAIGGYQADPAPVYPDAPRFLWALKDHSHGRIVTDASAERVQECLGRLEGGDAQRTEFWRVTSVGIHDQVGKRRVDAMLQVVHLDSLTLPGLDRAVEVHRPDYWRLLYRWTKHLRVDPQDVLAVGDEFETDLALPLALGMHVVLVDRGHNVMPWERPFLEHHSNARIVNSLDLVR